MINPSLLDSYVSAVKEHIPIKHKYFKSKTTDGDGNHLDIKGTFELSDKDYRSFISYSRQGFNNYQ